MENNNLETLKNQITEVVQNEEVCAAMLMCDSAEAVSELLAKNGIVATQEEISALKCEGDASVAKYKASGENELSEEQLEDVAGGGKFWRGVAAFAGGAVAGFGLGLVCGVCPAFTPVATKIAVGYSVVAGVWVSQG